jgi:hypothetical protein
MLSIPQKGYSTGILFLSPKSGYSPLPSRPTRNALVSPCLKDRGFTGGCDKSKAREIKTDDGVRLNRQVMVIEEMGVHICGKSDA